MAHQTLQLLKRGMFALALTAIALGTGLSLDVRADHETPGQAGMTKIDIYDNTHNIWNVTTNDPDTGGPDPVIGFVNFRPTVPGDPDHVIVTVALKGGAPDCDYNIELVVDANDPNAGLAPDGFHHAAVNPIGTLTTNRNGLGNSGAIQVDVTTLSNTALSGSFTYAHVDVEDYNGDCTEADGTGVVNNEYGASGQMPGQNLGLPVNMHWEQP